MATQTRHSPPRLEGAIESLLTRLRRRVRAYVWADGIAGALAVLGAGFWVSLAFDWLLEPPVVLRVAALVAFLAALGYVVYRLLVSRLLVRLHNRNLAMLVERRFKDFRDSLLTAVELAEEPEQAEAFNADMLAHTQRSALARASAVDVGSIFNPGPLVRRVSLAAGLCLSVVAFAIAAPEALAVWARRALLLSDELWPRTTRLMVDGLDAQGRVKIARGTDWQLAVKADAALGRQIPDVVEVRYSTDEGTRGRENMSREGIVAPGEAEFQAYAYTFKSVLAPLEFYVVGGDDRQGPFALDVVDSPTLSRMTLRCVYPAYIKRAEREIPVAGVTQLPRGTEVTILAEANKPLVAVQIDDVADENAPVTHRIDILRERGGPHQEFQFSVDRLDADKTLLFTLFDSDGIRSREAVRLSLAAVPDEPPQVGVQLQGIGTAITPQARLPASGEVSDDYGVERIWFDFHVDEAPPRERALSVAAGGREKLTASDALEVGPLELQPKQKLHWAVKAADGCALSGGPNIGTSQRYVLDVVTPEQLRAMLEARELTLRRRFETILEELTETRNLLTGIEAQPAASAAATTPASAREPGDADAPLPVAPAVVQAQRVLQNSQRSAHETREVAISFDAIREEMINNRVDTEELKVRLKEGVADPLKRIADERFPQLEKKLQELSKRLTAGQDAGRERSESLAEMDAILVEMRAVLDKMLELETFNEVLDMLRQIIDAQEKVSEQTKQKQKEKLKDLIE